MTRQAKTKIPAIEIKCPHCALSRFLDEWMDKHRQLSGNTAVSCVLEVVTDIVRCIDDPVTKSVAAVLVVTQVEADCRAILAGTYKPDDTHSTHEGSNATH